MPYVKQKWGYYDDTKTEEQNIQLGNVFTPERMNHIEDGIKLVEDENMPTEKTVTIKHNLGSYPIVQVMYWRYGLGTTILEGQPTGVVWDGETPYTIECQIEHVSRNEINVKVPLKYKLGSPVVSKINNNEYLLNEGIYSIGILLK